MSEQAIERAPGRRGSDFAELLRQVRRAGFLERRRFQDMRRIVVSGALLAFGVALFLVLGDSWWQLVTAGYLAVVFTQLGFVGHDAGHHQFFRRRRTNSIIGLVCANMLIGLSYGWWVDKHNRHHAHPNQAGHDPDIGTGALTFTTETASVRSGIARFLVRYQAWYFFPLLLLEGLNLHAASVRALLRHGKGRLTEAAMLFAHVACYFAVIFLVLSPVKAVVFICVHQALFGLYLGCAFAPNHKGMPAPTGGDAADYLRRQVLTSRNVRGGWFVDWTLGGLNYQIEHHLFPSMPRRNLKRVRPLVRSFCAARGVAYHECGAFASYRQALRHLRAVGHVASAMTAVLPPDPA